MDVRLKPFLARLRTGLEGLYGPCLVEVYVYGSYARGNERAESDLDVLIVLDDFDAHGEQVDRVSELAASLSLQYGVCISKIFVRERDWRTGRSPFLLNVREEAVPA